MLLSLPMTGGVKSCSIIIIIFHPSFFIYTIFSHIFKQRCKDSPLQTTHRSCHCDSLFYEHLPFGIEFKMSSMEIIKSVTHIRRQSVREQ